MSNLQIYFKGWEIIAKNFWLVFIFIIAGLIYIGRSESLEKKRVAKANKRDKLEGVYHQERMAK